MRHAAISTRVPANGGSPSDDDSVHGELRDAVDALQERVDFLERALVAVKEQSGRVLPAKGERADSTANTPS